MKIHLRRWRAYTRAMEMAMNNDPAMAEAEELLERPGSLDEVKRYYEAGEMAIHGYR